MKKYENYDIELYFYGGEPFCIDETYEFIRECAINRSLATDIMSDELRYYLNIRNANIDLDSYERIAL